MFTSVAKELPDWAFKYLNFASSVWLVIKELAMWAQEQGLEPIDDYVGMPDHFVAADVVDISGQMYTSVAQLVKGEAFDIMKNVTDNNGLGAWRRLSHRFDPQTACRRRSA
eukprot:12741765-Heterocapsa_arctica.AAC.1